MLNINWQNILISTMEKSVIACRKWINRKKIEKHNVYGMRQTTRVFLMWRVSSCVSAIACLASRPGKIWRYLQDLFRKGNLDQKREAAVFLVRGYTTKNTMKHCRALRMWYTKDVDVMFRILLIFLHKSF